MLTNCGRVPLDMIGGQCDKRVCDAPAAGLDLEAVLALAAPGDTLEIRP